MPGTCFCSQKGSIRLYGGTAFSANRNNDAKRCYEGNFFAYTDSPASGKLYAEFVDGAWVAPRDSCDIWEAKVLSWEEFERRTSTRPSL